MTDHSVSPGYELPVGPLTYQLDASFATLRAVQQSFREDLLPLQRRVLDMRLDEIAKLVSLGAGKPEDEIGQAILDECGVTEAAYQLLKGHLMAWLYVAMAPKAEREKRAADMGKLVGKLSPASRGKSTRNSPSASSAGTPTASGGATSGS